MPTRRDRAIVVAALLAAAAAGSAWFAPARRDDGGAVPASDPSARGLLCDLQAWDAADREARRGAAAWVAARTPGFAFVGTERFGSGAHRHEIAVFSHAATGLEFSLILPDEFLSGSADDEPGRFANESPRRRVRIGAAFLMSRTETTLSAWARGGGGGRVQAPGSPDDPVGGVAWSEADVFCTAAGLRLPSEDEWEYACRAGTTTRFWAGDDIEDAADTDWIRAEPGTWARLVARLPAWIGGGSVPLGPHPVARKRANPFGLHDVHGNVWEWCADEDSGAAGGTRSHVVRGGGWNDDERGARAARRFPLPSGYVSPVLGFRPAASVPE